MDIEMLRERLIKAYRKKSLRELAKITEVSHETLRKLIANSNVNLTIERYNLIDQGLAKNEF